MSNKPPNDDSNNLKETSTNSEGPRKQQRRNLKNIEKQSRCSPTVAKTPIPILPNTMIGRGIIMTNISQSNHARTPSITSQPLVTSQIPQVHIGCSSRQIEIPRVLPTLEDQNIWERQDVSADQKAKIYADNRLKRKAIVLERRRRKLNPEIEYHDIGDQSFKCEYCGAMMWYEERTVKSKPTKNPKFSMCCREGKVELPLLQAPPDRLKNLIQKTDPRSNDFIKNIRTYNMMFSFTSMGGRVALNKGHGPYSYRLSGQNCHRIGTLMPTEGYTPKFSQLYIYDTENEEQNRIRAHRSNEKNPVDITIVRDLKEMIDEHNPVAKAYRMARERITDNSHTSLRLKLIYSRQTDARRYNLPTTSEVAALIVDDMESHTDMRDIVIETKNHELKRISEIHPLYLPLQYPLLFPYGEDGFRIDIELSEANNNSSRKRFKCSMREFFAFRIQERPEEESLILYCMKLFQQFLVDAFTMIESTRLQYIRKNQSTFRSENFKGIAEAVQTGNTEPSTAGKRVHLPSSFTGSKRNMIELYQDAMAICKTYGHPDLFLTFTCNPKWPEITRFVKARNLSAEDKPDIIARVFKIKLDHLINDLKEGKIFGHVKAVIYTIEFQKRGLPHAHIVLFLHQESKLNSTDDIDKVISAEIPDIVTQPALHKVVSESMMHGPCGVMNPKNVCMDEGKCLKHFPKSFQNTTTINEEGYPVYKRRDNGRIVEKNGHELDSRYVVPYNPTLLLKYGAHINVEWCNQARSIKYLFKYITKGNDRATVAISTSRDDCGVDEIKQYYDCRYVSSCEAAWRIFGFNLQYRSVAVDRLSFHLPNEHPVMFDDDEPLDSVFDKAGKVTTKFLSWMEYNKNHQEARQYCYDEFPAEYVWNNQKKEWKKRSPGGKKSIGRVYHVPLGTGEAYYLRILLNHVRGPTCYEDIRTVNGTIHSSFKEACYAMGLLDDEKEYIDGIVQAAYWCTPYYLRNLFAMLLIAGSLSRPEFVWEHTWRVLSEDILDRQRKILRNKDLKMSDEQLKNYALAEIEKLLNRNGSTLRRFEPMPLPDHDMIADGMNKLIQEELRYDREELRHENMRLISTFTDEQRGVYDELMAAVSRGKGGVFFLYGYGGTGKTFIWRSLSAAIRCKGGIVLTVASSGIASLLLPGGRTAHSRFCIPLTIYDDSMCNIKPRTPLAELLSKVELIIWDEAPMTNKHCFEALDRSLRDVLRNSDGCSSELPFGGKVVVFGGDFRQILPVITKGTRQDIVSSSLNSSYLWAQCKVLRLTRNMRLQGGQTEAEVEKLREFSEWVLSVGDGTIGDSDDGEATIDMPDDLCILDTNNPTASIVEAIYPSVVDRLSDAKYFEQRSILAPTLEIVEKVNDYVMSLLPDEEQVYFSSDSISQIDGRRHPDEDLYSTEYLNSIKLSGMPNHSLRLKVGVPVMLLRNIDQSSGLCNGTRLVVTRLMAHTIEAEIISGTNIGFKVLIPRLLLTPSDVTMPFKFRRRQFPLMVCFAMTINKSQGQSLSRVGLFLPRPVFTHGQLYVGLSRVTSRDGLTILICDSENHATSRTTNVVYKEVFHNML